MSDPAALEIVEISVGLLDPNPWNPNRMTPAKRAKLVAYLRDQGLVEPLVVRPHPRAAGRWEILGGEHRWTICRDELGRLTVPCSVVHVDDRRAKILTINLNELSGEAVPHLLAGLLEELAREAPARELAGILPYDEAELMNRIEVGRSLPMIEQRLEAEQRAQTSTAPTMLTFMVPPEHIAAVEAAVAQAAASLPGGKNGRGRALAVLAEAYMRPAAAAPPADIRRDGADQT